MFEEEDEEWFVTNFRSGKLLASSVCISSGGGHREVKRMIR